MLNDPAFIRVARKRFNKEGTIEIDLDAKVSRGFDRGAYVQAWVWVDLSDVIKEEKVIAIYKNRVYRVIDDDWNGFILSNGDHVDYSDEQLVVDPTDAQLADVENLDEWTGLHGAALEEQRQFLRGARDDRR